MTTEKILTAAASQGNPVTIKACKIDGSVHRSWKAELISETAELLTFVGIFETEIRHPLLGVIRPNTISYEYYWKNRWFNVFRFHEPTGELRNFYCNVNLPPVFDGETLTYIDLDIDVFVLPDLSYEILDREEFEENIGKHNYQPDLIAKAHAALDEIIGLINKRKFPFDYFQTEQR